MYIIKSADGCYNMGCTIFFMWVREGDTDDILYSDDILSLNFKKENLVLYLTVCIISVELYPVKKDYD